MKALGMLDAPEEKLRLGAQMVRDLINAGKPAYAFEATPGEADGLRMAARDYAKAHGYTVSIRSIRTELTSHPQHTRRYNLIVTKESK